MANITEDDINQIENVVREEGLDHATKMLQKKLDVQCDVLLNENHLVDYFGESYASDPSNFRFVIGDKKLIRLVRDHLVKKQNENGAKYMRRFRKKPDRKNKTNRPPNNQFPGSDDIDDTNVAFSTDLTISLFEKLKKSMKLFGIDDAIIQSMTQNLVSVKVVDGNIAAEIFCVLCQNDTTKKRKLNGKKVFYKCGSNSKYWVLSNFIEHLKMVHKLKQLAINTKDIQKKDSNEASSTDADSSDRSAAACSVQKKCKALASTTKEADIENMASKHNFTIEYVEVDVDEETSESSSSQNCFNGQNGSIFRQISAQLSKMLTATLSNSDQTDKMIFELNENEIQSLEVATIMPNGACMFGAVAHQLMGQKINSDEHMNATKQIRKDVVHHISTHFSSFQKELQARVYAEINPHSIKDMDQECATLLNNYLPLDHYWGGAETLKAIREMYKVNILVLNERGTCHFFNHFSEEYDRTLLLAFRLQDKTAVQFDIDSYDHYDSVYDISSDVIPKIIEILFKRKQKMNVEFDDTL